MNINHSIKRPPITRWALLLTVLAFLIIGGLQTPRLLSDYYTRRGAATLPYSEAIAHYDRAIQFNPRNDEAYYLRGFTYLRLGRYEEALSDLNMAIDLNPEMAYAYADRADVYFQSGEPQLALENYDKAILLDPSNPFYYYGRSSVYAELLGDYSSAIHDIELALSFETTEEVRQIFLDRIVDLKQREND